jgi:hypothetical protein
VFGLTAGCNNHAEKPKVHVIPPVKDTIKLAKKEVKRKLIKECYFDDLSNEFDIGVKCQEILLDSNRITISVFSKKDRKDVQRIQLSGGILYNSYLDCTGRSYETKKNDTAESIDNDYGEVVVGDFNFDNKSDFALITDASPTMGPLYSFYLQGSKLTFHRDNFLSDSMSFFPAIIDQGRHTVATVVRSGYQYAGINTYKLNTKTNKWREISHTYHPADTLGYYHSGGH